MCKVLVNEMTDTSLAISAFRNSVALVSDGWVDLVARMHACASFHNRLQGSGRAHFASCWHAAVVNYDALRDESKRGIPQKIASIRTYVGKLQKAQRAAEKALDM